MVLLYIWCSMDPINISPPNVNAAIYQHQPDPSWLGKPMSSRCFYMLTPVGHRDHWDVPQSRWSLFVGRKTRFFFNQYQGGRDYTEIPIHNLVGGFKHELYFPLIYGMSSFPLTKSYFSRWLKPPTSNTFVDKCIYRIIYSHPLK